MFRLSRKGEYALRTIFHLSIKNETCTTAEIAEIQDIPQPFLKKIIQSLIVSGLISSTKGQRGGIKLNLPPEKISVKTVIEGVEGSIFLNDCLLCEGTCPRDKICPLHEMWQKGQLLLMEFLDSQKFDSLVLRHVKLFESVNSKYEVLNPAVLRLMKLSPGQSGFTSDTSGDLNMEANLPAHKTNVKSNKQ